MYRDPSPSVEAPASAHPEAPRVLSRDERLAMIRAGLVRYLARREAELRELGELAEPETEDSSWDPDELDEVLS